MKITLDKLLEIHTMFTDERAMIMNDYRYDRVNNLFNAVRKRFEEKYKEIVTIKDGGQFYWDNQSAESDNEGPIICPPLEID